MTKKKLLLARLVTAVPRKVIWNGPKGPKEVQIKRIRTKSARIILPNGEEQVVPLAELDLHQRWKAKYKPEKSGD